MRGVDHRICCRLSTLILDGPRHGEEPSSSDFRVLRKSDRVINVDAEVANGILDVGVIQQDFHGAKVAGCFLDERSPRSAHRMRAVFSHVEASCTDPRVDQPGVLAGAEVIRPAAGPSERFYRSQGTHPLRGHIKEIKLFNLSASANRTASRASF